MFYSSPTAVMLVAFALRNVIPNGNLHKSKRSMIYGFASLMERHYDHFQKLGFVCFGGILALQNSR